MCLPVNLCVKHFSELTTEELYAILRLRVSVFVVEQNCPYMELDNLDQDAVHVWLQDENGLEAYLRVLDRGSRASMSPSGASSRWKDTAVLAAGF